MKPIEGSLSVCADSCKASQLGKHCFLNFVIWQRHPHRTTGSGTWTFLLSFQRLFPFCLFEAHQHKIVSDEHGPLDQQSIRCQQGIHFVLRPGRQLVLQSLLFVEQAAGVEEFFQGQAADLVPLAQLGRSRPVGLDMPDLALNPVGIQPLLCLLTGASLRIAKKNHVVTLL